MLQDLRFAVRSLSRRPGFRATAVLSVVDGVLLRPFPCRASERIAILWHEFGYGAQNLPAVHPLDVEDYRQRSRLFEESERTDFAHVLEPTGRRGPPPPTDPRAVAEGPARPPIAGLQQVGTEVLHGATLAGRARGRQRVAGRWNATRPRASSASASRPASPPATLNWPAAAPSSRAWTAATAARAAWRTARSAA